MNDLWQRFKREAKANGKKAGLLAALFAFGCCFWIPMLTRAIAPKRAGAAVAHSVVTASPSSAIPTEVPSASPTPGMDTGRFWSNLAAALTEDPMFQSADVETASRDPFQVEETPEPLPVLFAEEPPPTIEPESGLHSQQQLELSSTIVGRTRRAALINGQLYHLGRKIEANGRSYSLTKIESHRVVLTSSDHTVELKLTRPMLKNVMTQGGSKDPPNR